MKKSSKCKWNKFRKFVYEKYISVYKNKNHSVVPTNNAHFLFYIKKCTKFVAGSGDEWDYLGELHMWAEASFTCERKQASHVSGSKLHMWAEASFTCERKQASHVSGSIILNPGHGAKFEFEFKKMSNHVFQQMLSSFDRK